jgi:hypothetical protein
MSLFIIFRLCFMYLFTPLSTEILDTLRTPSESPRGELNRHVLFLLFLLLRDMSVIWSKFEYTDAKKELEELKVNGMVLFIFC